MKLFVYSYREFDEADAFRNIAEEFGIETVFTRKPLLPETASLAEGCDYVTVIAAPIDNRALLKLHEMGVRMVCSRTIGIDHVDLDYARSIGLKISRSSYSPHVVAEYTLMLMLMCTRKMKLIMSRNRVQDYTLKGNIGKLMHEMTVGVIGTGNIGTTVASYVSGMGAKVIAYAPRQKKDAMQYVEYVPLEKLFREADIITLHAPATSENFHMLDRKAFGRMKDGVVIVNTARGSIIDTGALIEALESGKVGAAALDVVENDSKIYYKDRKGQVPCDRQVALLNSFPNVIMTPHTAFYTEEAVYGTIRGALESCVLDDKGEGNPWRVV